MSSKFIVASALLVGTAICINSAADAAGFVHRGPRGATRAHWHGHHHYGHRHVHAWRAPYRRYPVGAAAVGFAAGTAAATRAAYPPAVVYAPPPRVVYVPAPY